jgi:hypothetical protein
MKKALLFTAILITSLVYSQIPTAGLVKEYKFNTSPGIQLTDSNVQTTLQSGVVNLTRTGLNGFQITDRVGNVNSAIQLNGDYLQSGGTQQTYVNEYTISFWMKSTTIDNVNSKFIIHQKGSSPQRGFSVELYNGQIRFYNVFGYGNTSITDYAQVFTSSNVSVADGNWHHVVCAVNSTATSMVFAPYVAWTINYYSKMYVDNVLVNNSNQTVVPSYTSGQLIREAINRFQPLYIGSYPGNTTAAQKYTDAIDQVRYYERELTLSEIQDLYYDEHPQNPIYVNINATGTNDGSSWENAYTNIQNAINNNPYKDDIWVANGTYTPSSNGRNSTFLISNRVKIYGGFNGTETLLEQRDFRNNITILNGDVNGNDNANINPTEATRSENLYHILTVKGNPSEVTVDGFNFSGANANGTTLTSGTPSDQYLNNRGGAIFLHTYTTNADVTLNLENCIFEKNSSTDTSVFSNWFSSGVSTMYQRPNFTNCIFTNNFSTQNGQFLLLSSGGFGQYSFGKIINSLFYNNTSQNGPSALYFFASTANGGNGGSLGFDIFNSTFMDNSGISGRVIRVDNTSNVAAKNTIIYGNGSSTPIQAITFGGVASNIIEGAQFGGSNTNPLLDTNYYPTSSSIVIDNGSDTWVPSGITTDLAGNNRFVGNVDIGAYEYDAALSSNSFTSFKDFVIYPNPTNGYLNIQSFESISNIKVYSSDGRKLLETQSTFLEISNYPSGIYFLTLETENGSIGTQKIIKK